MSRKPKKKKPKSLDWEKGAQKRVEEMRKVSGHSRVLNLLESRTRPVLLEALDSIWDDCRSRTPEALPNPFLHSMLFGDDREERALTRNTIELPRLRAFIADLWVHCQLDLQFDPKAYFDNLWKGRQQGRVGRSYP